MTASASSKIVSELASPTLRDDVRRILETAARRTPGKTAARPEWSLQGMGMFRLYLSRELRLHVWDSRFIVANVSTLHTHPWHFRSEVLSGVLTDHVFEVVQSSFGGLPYYRQKIVCGPGGGVAGDVEPVRLLSMPSRTRTHTTGELYERHADDIHETVAKCGTVTVIHRAFREDTEHAFVYFRRDRSWVSAEPRPALPEEVWAMADMALDRWDSL